MAGNIMDSKNIFCLILALSLLSLQTIEPVLGKAVKHPDENNPDGLFEGDILMDEATLNIIANETDEDKRSAVTNTIQLWPGGVVPYKLDPMLGSAARTVIAEAIKELNRKTCIRFQPKTSSAEVSYVNFVAGSGCYSYVGRTGRKQDVSIGSGCEQKGIVLHEMMHALGFFHTSSRTDRDSYVVVYQSNVKPGMEINFKKYPHGAIDSFGAPYDVNSLMHLSREAFAKKGLYTILARAGPSVALGQRVALSPVDLYQLNALYNCGSRATCLTALGLQSGAISNAAISASSSRGRMYSPGEGRLHNSPSIHGSGAWCADTNYGSSYWIQVYLGQELIRVTAIATQGMLSYVSSAYITSYDVYYRRDYTMYLTKYQSYTKSAYGPTNSLPGNWDDISVQYNALTPTFYARYVRVYPRGYVGYPCIRIEIYGCKVNS